jgi:hypothetical protein
MVDTIFRLTVLTVMALAAINAVHITMLLIRLVRHMGHQHPSYGFRLWLPLFTSVNDVRDWLEAWRTALRPDPAMVAWRADVRHVIGRHIYLALISQSWAMAVSAIAPRLV